jgi:hypothetical protein
MLFRTTDHYDIYDNELLEIESNTNKTENECFICYEVALEDEKNTIEMYKQPYYNKKCQCNGYIHLKCLNEWYDRSLKCPICRTFIEKKRPTTIPINITFIRVFIINCFNKVTSFFVVFAFIYFSFDFYLYIINRRISHEHSCLIYENSCLLYTEEMYKEYRPNSNNY